MENQNNKPEYKSSEEISSTELNEEPYTRSKWQYIVFQILFLLSGVILFVIINYIFGFMKGN
jgi:hypothetical protein